MMKQLIQSFFTTAFVMILFFNSNAQTNNDMHTATLTAEQLKVLNTIETMTDAFHKGDINGVMASYESGALVNFEPETPVRDEQVLREMFQGIFQINPKFVFSGHEVFITGNIATHIAPWTMTGQAPDGTPIEQSGLSMSVLRKQTNGEWLFIFDNPHGGFLLNQ